MTGGSGPQTIIASLGAVRANQLASPSMDREGLGENQDAYDLSQRLPDGDSYIFLGVRTERLLSRRYDLGCLSMTCSPM